MGCWIVYVYGAGAFVFEKLNSIAFGFQFFGLIFVAFPIPLSTRGFVFPGFDLCDAHHFQECDVHHLEAVPIAALCGCETDEKAKLMRALID